MLKIIKSGNILIFNELNKQWSACNEPIKELMYSSEENVCELEEGVTFGDIFLLIGAYKEFFVDLYGPIMIDFLEEINKREGHQNHNDINYLEVCWLAEEVDGFLEENVQLKGWGDEAGLKSPLLNKDDQGNIQYNVALIPINELKNSPICLNDEYKILKANLELSERYIKGEDGINQEDLEEVIFKTKRKFTLADILDAVFFEISFHGSPSDRDYFKEEIFNTIESAKDDAIKDYQNNDFTISPIIESVKDSEKNSLGPEDDAIDEIDNMLSEMGE